VLAHAGQEELDHAEPVPPERGSLTPQECPKDNACKSFQWIHRIRHRDWSASASIGLGRSKSGSMRFEKKLMRISPKPPDTYPWYLRPFFWNQRRKYGAVLDSARLWARTPKVFLGVAFLYGMIDRRNSPLPPILRSLITVRVSQLNGCRFCVDINSATLLKRGGAVGKVEALDAWQQSDLFSESERVALEYAEAVTLRSDAIEERLMERLKEHFEDDAIIELTALIAFQNLSSKFNSALGVPPQGFCRIPPREK
jgi:uncharacterized peroxidase-related enzyme